MFDIVEAETMEDFKLKYRSYRASQPELSAQYSFSGPVEY